MRTYGSIDNNLIGLRIKEIRKRKGITQAQLAEMTDLSVPYVSYLENGKKKKLVLKPSCARSVR